MCNDSGDVIDSIIISVMFSFALWAAVFGLVTFVCVVEVGR